jgi:TetR/AcrR family transcriptional regulator, tetracycline repressor protein
MGAGPRSRPDPAAKWDMTRDTLSREKVLDAALRLADLHGLGALSMRKLAAELGVEAMSLYNHVANKADLLDGVTGRVFEGIALPDPGLPWEERLRALANGAFAAFAAHPEVVRALAADQANPRSIGALQFIDALLAALLDSGIDERTAARRYRSLFGLLFGSVLVRSVDLTGGYAPSAEPIGEWFKRSVAAARLPSLARALPALLELDCGPSFSEELEFYIDAIRAAHD